MKKILLFIALLITIATTFIPVERITEVTPRSYGGFIDIIGCNANGYSGYGFPLTYVTKSCECICRDNLSNDSFAADEYHLFKVYSVYALEFIGNYFFYFLLIYIFSKIYIKLIKKS